MRRLITVVPMFLGVGAALIALSSASAAPAGTTHLPDLQTIIPTDSFSVGEGADGRELRYTHLVYNNGPGPLEIQPQYSEATGGYRGMQQLFTHDTDGAWSLVSEIRVPDAFEFHAVHGHFHFPLAAFGLYAVTADGGVGAPVSLSPKTGFCISDSYIYNADVEHSGVFVGEQGSCADPATLRGISVGGADEYDYRDPGQAIPVAGVPDGTYWFRAMTDPNNDIAELDESNNETDVLVTVAGGQVSAGTVTHPDTTPPAVSLAAPADGAGVSGTVSLSASTPLTGAGRVEFVVDGERIGTSPDTAPPYSLAWDSTTVVDGQHWLAARATDAQGHTNTSAVAAVNVANAGASSPPALLPPQLAPLAAAPSADTTPPQVSVSDPATGATLSGITNVGAVAADNVGVTSVRFNIDGQPLGAPVTAPPFMTQLNTRAYSDGRHTITAEASDAAGNVGTSAAVTVTIDNSAPPPATISIDTQKSAHTKAKRAKAKQPKSKLASPAITTTKAGDVLVAFVGLDGPNTPRTQTAKVAGAGLTWSLVKRSNTQAGDAEIWAAKATGKLKNAVVTATPERSGYDGSLTVIAFKDAAGTGVAGASGAPSGAPNIYLPAIGTGSWVFAVGSDRDRAVARTPVTGQVLRNQWIATKSGGTFWVQSTAAPNSFPSLVTIHDNAPTNDRWNYAAVEVTPARGR
jgi:hypothetical protein